MAGEEGKEEEEEFDPRPYQVELYLAAKQHNTIVCLGTGTGKTFIAIMLMRDSDFALQLKGSYESLEAKRTFFLVPTRPLVIQQASEIKRHFGGVVVKGFTGDMNVDFFKDSDWLRELSANQVLVMTPQILLNMLNHSFITFDRINLLVIDEVHWAAKKKGKKESGHPYKQIMKLYNEFDSTRRPRVLGLSASLINSSMRPELFDDAITDLEQTYCAICNTSDVAQLCGTNPKEIVWNYENQRSAPSAMAQVVVKGLEVFIYAVKKIDVMDQSVAMSLSRVKKCLTNVRNMLADPKDQVIVNRVTGASYPVNITWMGVWCASVAIDKFIEEIQQFREFYINVNPIHAQLLQCVIKYLSSIKLRFQPELDSDPLAPLNTASPKMHRLLELLRKYKPTGAEKSKLCGIVFVNQRSVAKVLADWLNKLKELRADYQFIDVNWVVGHSARPGFASLVTSFTDKKQQEIIDEFRNENLNLLVATSVLEEGLDVRQCNLVVRYDKINTFREYIQSKGRARAQDAYYYIMSSEEDSNRLYSQLRSFRAMEERIENLNNKQKTIQPIGQTVGNDGDSEDEDQEYLSADSNARINTRTAISLLYRYCTKLPTDSFTKLVPIFEIQSENGTQFRCSVQMPVNSALKNIVYGRVCKSKAMAKKSAALEACKQLFHLGELNDRFLPISKEYFVEEWLKKLDLKVYNTDDKPGAGTRNKNNIYSKRWAQALTRSPSQKSNQYYLNSISMTYPKIDCFRDTRLTFGAITTSPLVNKCLFSVFLNIGAALTAPTDNHPMSNSTDVQIIPLEAIVITSEEMKSIERFHCFAFEDVLRLVNINRNLFFNTIDSKSNLLIVPLINGRTIDWSFIAKINNFQPIQLKPVSVAERLLFNKTFDVQSYRDCVFYPWYRGDEANRPLFYDSIKITEFTPRSKWTDGSFATYEDFFRRKYSIEICNKSLPLIEGRLVKRCAQLNSFRTGRSDPDREERFVPELMAVHPFPSSLWRQALCLPSILFRLNCLLLAEELRKTIHLETDPKIGSFDVFERQLSLSSKFNSNPIDSTLLSNKRLLSIEDLEDGCEGHPFDYGMDFTDEPSFIGMASQKKKRQKQSTAILIESSNTRSTGSFGTTVSNNININSASDESFLTLTHIVIDEFNEVIQLCQLSPQSQDLVLDLIPYDTGANDHSLSYGETYPYIFTGDIGPYIREKYDSTVGDPIEGPAADVMLTALTLLNANDSINLERLETIGDSFLKFVTTAFLYYSCPELDEGRLTYLRSIQICNCNLYHIGRQKKICELLVSNKWYPHLNWLPPSYHITDEADMTVLTHTDNSAGAFRHHLISDKSIADSIEALIGAHLLSGGNKSALIFMELLGLKVSPKGHQIDYLNGDRRVDSDIFCWLPVPKSPLWANLSDQELNDFLLRHYNGSNLDHFEHLIGYTFKDKAFLIEAFTHSSYYLNGNTDCYQRLEFLGDSVLDYLITRHIFSDPNKQFSPGELTDLRSALVNNAFFASIAVKFQFHKFLKTLSPDLFRAVETFVKEFERNKVEAINNCFHTMTDEECCDPEEVEVPKALGDIFESIAGAIYLDNGLSLDGVWNVYYKLLKPEIDYFSANVPKMPVRELREKCQSVCFGRSNPITGRKIQVEVKVDGREYVGIGKNRKFAKIAASKSALRAMKGNEK